MTQLRGDANGRARLTTQDVLEILTLLKTGQNYTQIGRTKQVHPATVMRIARKQSWKHIPRDSDENIC